MAEAVAKVPHATPGKEATARSGSRPERSARSAGSAAMDEQYRFTGAAAKGLTFERRWTTPGTHPYDEVEWELRDAIIQGADGQRVGQGRLRAEGRRGSQGVEPAGHQRRREQVLPWSHRHAQP